MGASGARVTVATEADKPATTRRNPTVLTQALQGERSCTLICPCDAETTFLWTSLPAMRCVNCAGVTPGGNVPPIDCHAPAGFCRNALAAFLLVVAWRSPDCNCLNAVITPHPSLAQTIQTLRYVKCNFKPCRWICELNPLF